MTKLNKSWMAVVAAALLLGTLVGVIWARPHDRPQAQDITRKVTVPGAFFHPSQEGVHWLNYGEYIKLLSGSATFSAPVVFPCLPSVTVERMIFYVDDQDGLDDSCVTLHRSRPWQGDSVMMGSICSSDTTTGVQAFTTSNIYNAVVWPSHGVYMELVIDGNSIKVYGVRVEYHRNI
jgi:hypothetical protein